MSEPSPPQDAFQAVYDAPDDDAPRAALAEALRAAGDPRGDFIALSLEPSLDKAGGKEKRRPSRAHGAEWLEPLRRVVQKSVKWARGFPVAAELAMPPPAERDASIGVPALATLRALHLGKRELGFDGAWLQRFLLGSPLRNLRVLTGVWRDLLPALAASDPPWKLERLHCLYWGGRPGKGEVKDAKRAFEAQIGLPALRDLTLTYVASGNGPSLYPWLATTAFGKGLRSLTMDCEWSDIPAWHAQLVAWGDAVSLERVTFGHEDQDGRFRHDWLSLVRTERGFTKITGVVGHMPAGPPGRLRNEIRKDKLARLDDILATLPDLDERAIERR